MNIKKLATCFAAMSLWALFSGCSSKEETATNSSENDPELAARIAAFREEVKDYYATKVSLPPELYEDLEAGRVTQEEIDERTTAGEFPKFFQYKTLDDLPKNLVWENGSDMPELGSPKAKKGGTAYSRIQDFPRTLRTIGPDSSGSFRPFLLDYVAVFLAHQQPNTKELGPSGIKYYGGLAKEWAVDKQNHTVYARIHPDARWSDGEPITVDDYFFMFFFHHSKYIKAPWYNNAYNRFWSGITKYDDHTLAIKVSKNKPDFTSYALELPPKPEHFYGELGDDFPERYQWKFEPTTGPYNLNEKDIRKGDSITFTRNKNWWAKDLRNWRYRHNYDKLHIKVVRDDAKAFEMFKKGELDAASLTLSDLWYDELPDNDSLVESGYIKKIVFYNDRPRPPYGLWINTSKPLLDDKNIRKGVQYASNWDLVIEKYFRGDYQRLNHTAIGYGPFSHPGIKARMFSIEKALEYFGKAGFSERGPDGILVNEDGKRLSFSLTTGYTRFKDPLTIVKEEAAKAGLDLRIQILDGTAGYKMAQEKQHEIHFVAFGYGAEMYPRYWETFHSHNAYNADGSVKTQTNNLNAFANDKMDELIESYRNEIDPNEMIKLAHQMEEILHEEAVFVPAFYMPFYRIGYWRWRHYPEDFDVMISESSGEYGFGWMDVDEKVETLKAEKSGKTFEKSIKVYDQYKND